MQGWVVLGVVELVVIVLLVLAGALAGPRRRAWSIGLAAVALVLLIAIAVAAIVPVLSRTTQPRIESGTLDGSAMGFRADIANERLAFDGDAYTFRYTGGWDRLVGELERSYPAGEVAGTMWTAPVGEVRYIVTASDGSTGWREDDVFILRAELAVVGEAGAGFSIPFPGGAGVTWLPLSTATDLRPLFSDEGPTLAELEDYYAQLEDATCAGDGCIVPTSTGGSAAVRVDAVDGSLTVTAM